MLVQRIQKSDLVIVSNQFADVAQMVERGPEEARVSGSLPFISTISRGCGDEGPYQSVKLIPKGRRGFESLPLDQLSTNLPRVGNAADYGRIFVRVKVSGPWSCTREETGEWLQSTLR